MGFAENGISKAHQNISSQDVILAPLLRDIKFSFQYIEWLTFIHILREINEKDDDLSREAFTLPVGAFGIYELFHGVEKKSMEFCL